MRIPGRLGFAPLVLLGALFSSCDVPDTSEALATTWASDAGLRSAVDCQNAFALDLFHALRGDPESQPENLFFSPVSLFQALALVNSGAAGTTRTQIEKVLRCGPTTPDLIHTHRVSLERSIRAASEHGSELSVINGLWRQAGYELLQDYMSVASDGFRAHLSEVDFMQAPEEARRTINGWVSGKTEGKIGPLLPVGGLDARTRLVVANAIYFHGSWAQPFDAEDTGTAEFTRLDGTSVPVRMMALTDQFRYGAEDGVQMLELPYEGSPLSLLILLPEQASELAEIEAAISAPTLARWLEALESKKVAVYMPKFRIDSGRNLKSALSEMGMTDAFSMMHADFSAMTDRNDLYVSAVYHSAAVTVDEHGTVAAAAGGAVMAERIMPPTFRADRPFLFLIRDTETGAFLFLGRLINPRP